MYITSLQVALNTLYDKVGNAPISNIKDDYDGITFCVGRATTYKFDYETGKIIKNDH